jgi:hypothetical protein
MCLALLGLEPQIVDGPTTEGISTWSGASIPAPAFRVAVTDAADFVRRNGRLPAQVFIGAKTLSLADFASTLAGSIIDPEAEIRVLRGHIEFDQFFAKDPIQSFNWVIHPTNFSGGPLLELARLQGWTLKPARMAH